MNSIIIMNCSNSRIINFYKPELSVPSHKLLLSSNSKRFYYQVDLSGSIIIIKCVAYIVTQAIF